MAPSVIVVGAGGNMGPFIMQALISHKKDFNRIAILTAPERTDKFAKYESQGVEVIGGSFADVTSYKGFDAVISLAGNAIMGDQPKMIDAAIAAGARHFIPSEFGVDIGQTPFLTERYFKDKHITRDHLRAKAKEFPGFHYTLVLIGAFAETLALTPVFGLDSEKKTFTYYGDAENEVSLSSMPDTARYTVESILMPFEPNESVRELRVPNGNWKIKDAIKLLGEIQGVQYTSHYLPVSVAREEQEKYRQEGNTDMELLSSLKAGLGSPFIKVPGPWDNNKFDFTPLTLEEMFRSFQN